ncbi:2-phospho-L-lactate guanylyltransferase [Lysobacter korlensis]|uniref:3-phospho-D-glycerate guanylyltransferase n=1 Tax=Lysobacter korlensis TaxID=553636 RepID=A0ABV6RVJ6_9GAMM
MASDTSGAERARHPGFRNTSWRVVVPFKGAANAKSRLAERYDPSTRAAIAVAMLRDTLNAVAGTPSVAGLVVVSSDPDLLSLLTYPGSSEGRVASVPVTVLPDPKAGLNPAISAGIDHARAADADTHVAVVLGDLPALRSADLAATLDMARAHPRAFLPDTASTGTTMITVSPGYRAEPLFGEGSAAAHAAAGFVALELPRNSGLRRDVDAPRDLDSLLHPGPFTRVALARMPVVDRPIGEPAG